MVWIPDYIRDELDELSSIQQTMSTLLQVSQANNILLARINRVPGVPVTMHIQFQGQAIDQPGTETDIQLITAMAVELDALDKPTAIEATKLVWSVTDPSVVNMTQNLDGSAIFQGLRQGTVQVVAKDIQIGLTALDTLTVSLSKANTIVIQFGDPTLDPGRKMNIKFGTAK